jgi:hypothetical protein
MTTTGKLRVTTPSEREIALIRDFDASPDPGAWRTELNRPLVAR